ncbi:MAG: hypothetical protein VX586_02730 [Candidatus Neomarinimicrobiota bacterium]|nr:hypothetical protein [Candidatus Neomarinimicrobiota bacterium]
MKKLVCFIFPITILLGQINYTGSIKPGNMYRLSDQSEISLPFRLAEAEVGYSIGDFEINTNSALEYRWSNNENELQLRETYLTWFPSWGEVNVGKQIHAWGAVDGNNPTDNLNPYDYYYMFLPGAERKVGTVSGSVKYYWNDWQMEGVFIPAHEGNRFPFGEEAFPLNIPMSSPELIDEEPGSEFGFRIQSTLGSNDYSLSYFDGRDRSFSYVGMTDSMPSFFYRNTSVLGFDLVSFIGDFTNRFEIGYFSTENDAEFDMKPLNDASYIQFAGQVEYSTENDIMFTLQIIGSEILEVNGTNYNFDPFGIPTETPMIEDEFQPGMGTPFAMFTDLGMMLSVAGNYWDNAVEIRGNTFSDLKDNQSMLGGGISYSPIENWDLELSITHFFGKEGTHFKEMEEFSHIRLGLGYHF